MLLLRRCAWLAILLVASAAFGQAPKTDDPGVKPPKGPDAPAKSNIKPDREHKDSEKPEAPTAEHLQQSIKDLAHPKFAIRQAASQQLIQAGVPGMQAAAEAAKTEDLELATRCLAVLSEGLASRSGAVRKAARTSLAALTKSDNTSVAQRAQQALDAPVVVPPILADRGKVVIQQVRVQFKNGRRELTVIENGKESVISDSNGKDITITIMDTVDGQKKTQTIQAKNEEELKQNHPEAHTLYSRFSGGKGIKVQIGGNKIGGNILAPFQQQAVPRAVNPFKAAELFDEVDKLRKKLEELNERLTKAAEADKPDVDELKHVSEELKTTTNRLREIRVESQVP